jgi:putative two-component system response regulator
MTLDEGIQKRARIVIVDDEPANVALLERILHHAGYANLCGITDPETVVATCTRTPPDLLLLDLHMPRLDGFELLEELKPWLEPRAVPVLVLTADTTREAKRRALGLGASDLLGKPFDASEALLRINNLLQTRFLQLELRRQNLILEERVRERTRDLATARLEALVRLAIAAEYRDDQTGGHIQRVGRTSEAIAEELGLDTYTVDLIRNAAPLHDVGKIGVSDRILLKPGPLTDEERESMKAHVRIGASILSNSTSPLLRMAEQIALTHHEWWDGNGYPKRLQGDEIPLSGRIVALADVFDALTQDRPYKAAVGLHEALAEIRSLSGRQFDPQVVAAFEELEPEALIADVERVWRPSLDETQQQQVLPDDLAA